MSNPHKLPMLYFENTAKIVTREIGEGCAELVAMFFEDGGDQNLFGWKMVVDAWLTNFDHLCDIRVTERRVAAISEEGVSGFKDSFCGITLHGGILPTGRCRSN